MTDRTEALIRAAFAAEADRAVDPGQVLAALERGRPRPRGGTALIVAGAVITAVATVVAVAAVLVPRPSDRAAAPVVGSPPPEDQDVLLVGLDDTDRADAVMLAHVDADGTTTVLSLPRDSWVTVPGLGARRLNAVYAEAGVDPLLATVRELTGVLPDHYALVDMAGFAELAGAVGGVRVCVRRPTTDGMTGESFPAGEQTVSGRRALAYLRQRHGLDEGDFDRMERQQAFLRATLSALRESPGALRHLLEVAGEHATLDPGWDVLGLAEQLLTAEHRQLSFATIPVQDPLHVTPNGAAVMLVDPVAVRAYVAAAFGDEHGRVGHEDPRGGVPDDVERPCVD